MPCQSQVPPCRFIPLVCLACCGLYFLTSKPTHEQLDDAKPVAAEGKLIRRVTQAIDVDWPGPDARIAEDQGISPSEQWLPSTGPPSSLQRRSFVDVDATEKVTPVPYGSVFV